MATKYSESGELATGVEDPEEAQEPASQIERVVKRRILLERAKVMLLEINQLFTDAEHWNSTRTPFEQINPDPNGELAVLREGLERMISG